MKGEKNETRKRENCKFVRKKLFYIYLKNNFEMGKASVNINEKSQELTPPALT